MWGRGIAGIVLSLIGAVWIAQGTNVLHGSGMSGQGMWAVIGVIVGLAGVALLVLAWQARSASAQAET